MIGVSAPRQQALIAAGQAVPNPIRIRGLIDTGASGTCVDPSVLTALGLTPTGSTLCHTPSTGSQPQQKDLYDVLLAIPAPKGSPFVVPTLAVMTSELLAAQGFHALIGRDVLSHCILTYNGTANFFCLAY